jgi:hypothetical protein
MHAFARPVKPAALCAYRTLTPPAGTTPIGIAASTTATLADAPPQETSPATPLVNSWSGVIGVEGQRTGDGRLIEVGALRWDGLTPETPLPFRLVREDVGAHDGATIGGRILTIERREGAGENGSTLIWATGDFDLGSEDGIEAQRLVHENLQRGVSMDLDDVSFEIRVASDLLHKDGEDDEEGGLGIILAAGTALPTETPTLTDPDREYVTGLNKALNTAVSISHTFLSEQADRSEEVTTLAKKVVEDQSKTLATTNDWLGVATAPADAPAAEEEPVKPAPKLTARPATFAAADDEEPHPERAQDGSDHEAIGWGMESDDELMVTTDARIRAATLVQVPAFAEALIALSDSSDATPAAGAAAAGTIIAAAAPVEPPAAWFEDPHFRARTPITIDEDGRFYGHLATWDVCHIASPNGAGVCVQAPHSADGYASFHTGAVRTREGTTIATGRITMNTGHAQQNASASSAAGHYDHTGFAAADVRAGEDQFGIWVAGGLRPGVTPEQVRTLRGSPLSGDWRDIRNGAGKLVGALAVNVPGFPIPRPMGLVASGEMVSLVAAGMVAPKRVRRPGTPGALSAGDLRYLKSLADRERATQRQEMRARVNRSKVAAFAATHRKGV